MSLRTDLYKKLYLVRSAEEMIKKHYSENEMKTPMHMSAGSEAIAVGVCYALHQVLAGDAHQVFLQGIFSGQDFLDLPLGVLSIFHTCFSCKQQVACSFFSHLSISAFVG